MAGGEHHKAERADTVAALAREEAVGLGAGSGVGSAFEGKRLVAADGVVDVHMDCGKDVQRNRQEAVGAEMADECVILCACGIEGAMVPLQGQLAGTDGGVECGGGVVVHAKVVDHQAVAAAAVGVVERHVRGFGIEGPSVEGSGEVVLVHGVVYEGARRGMEIERNGGVEHAAQRVGDNPV